MNNKNEDNKMKFRNFNGALALGVTMIIGSTLTHLTAQAPKVPAAPAPVSGVEPPIFKDYQAGLREAGWTDKPLFVIFRCER